MLTDLSGPRRNALALSALSLLAFATFELVRPAHPYADLSNGHWTDHFSHLNAARLFMRDGAAIWTVPLERRHRRLTPAERAQVPRDVPCGDCFAVPGWKKPAVQNWPQVVRFVPLGNLVLMAPLAALYHFTDVSFSLTNRLLIVLFLLCAHAGLFVLLEDAFAAPDGARLTALLATLLAASTVLHWTLEGFYDAVIAAPLLLCWRWLGQRRALPALAAYCAAAFLNFRAYYYAPWALAAATLALRERPLRDWTRRDALLVALCAVLAAGSLVPYALALRGLLGFDQYLSPLLIAKNHLDRGALVQGALVLGVALAAFARAGAWLDAATLAWIFVVLTQVRQTSPWYTVALVPFLASTPRGLPLPERVGLVRDGRLLAFAFIGLFVHGDRLVPGWVPQLFGLG